MKSETFNLYLEAIDPINSGELLSFLSVADYPHIKMTARKKMHKSLWSKANPFFKPLVITADKFFGKPKVKSDV